ncbi:hypothetical protein QR685DRAFT_217401 [Neurospora intermedia]|uniref:Uncharacterized protein n=1 Tax=Neurospora intermedia TaxID=5142 RepID=A0ABR3DGS3_NEUIN
MANCLRHCVRPKHEIQTPADSAPRAVCFVPFTHGNICFDVLDTFLCGFQGPSAKDNSHCPFRKSDQPRSAQISTTCVWSQLGPAGPAKLVQCGRAMSMIGIEIGLQCHRTRCFGCLQPHFVFSRWACVRCFEALWRGVKQKPQNTSEIMRTVSAETEVGFCCSVRSQSSASRNGICYSWLGEAVDEQPDGTILDYVPGTPGFLATYTED